MTHYTNDGCAGQPRSLTLSEGRQVRELARLMLVDTSLGLLDEVVAIGRNIALHFGPEGEWLLACLLAEYIRRGNNGAPAPGPLTLPQLSLCVPAGDPQADRLLCALSHPTAPYRSPAERTEALDAMRLPVQQFLAHAHEGNWPGARTQWQTLYTDTARTPRALAFTALLLLWAARATVRTAPTRSAEHHQETPR